MALRDEISWTYGSIIDKRPDKGLDWITGTIRVYYRFDSWQLEFVENRLEPYKRRMRIIGFGTPRPGMYFKDGRPPEGASFVSVEVERDETHPKLFGDMRFGEPVLYWGPDPFKLCRLDLEDA